MAKKRISLLFLLVLCLGALIALPVRTYELFNFIDPETGFYAQKSITTVILYVISAAVFIIPLVLGISYKNPIEKSRVSFSGAALGTAFLILAAGFVFACYEGLNDFSTLYKSYNDSTMYLEVGNNSTLTRSGAIDKLGEGIFAGLSAVYFLLSAASCFTKFNSSKLRLLALSPVLWCVFRIIFHFMRTISYINVSELFYELIMNVFAIMFFMAFAQVRSNVNAEGIKWKLFAYGAPAAFFSLMCFLPRFILTVTGNAELISDGSRMEICDFAVAVFIIIMLVGAAAGEKRKDVRE